MTDQARPIGALLEAAGFCEIPHPWTVSGPPFPQNNRMWKKDSSCLRDLVYVDYSDDELLWVVARHVAYGEQPDAEPLTWPCICCNQIVSEEVALLVVGIIPRPSDGEFTGWDPTAHDLAAAAAGRPQN
jgi:hypothetical protein